MSDSIEEFDYVVVGSGAGGGPVAANLAKAGFTVAVLEAGGDDEPSSYPVPAFHAFATEAPDTAWNFFVRHYADLNTQRRDRRNFCPAHDGVLYPRAGTLGGCTTHHAMIFVAPHDSDWDGIAAETDDPSWLAVKMRRYFTRLEACHYVSRPNWRWTAGSGHGFDGWVPSEIADPGLLLRDLTLAQIALSAAQGCFESGVWYSPRIWQGIRSAIASINPAEWRRFALLRGGLEAFTAFFDPNDRRRIRDHAEGPIFTPLTVNHGVRAGTRELLLATERSHRDLLTIKRQCLATRVVLEGSRATGVEYVEGEHLYRADPFCRPDEQDSLAAFLGRAKLVRARREIILAGGTFNTPQLLQLSGIGPGAGIARQGIVPRIDLPGVGRNLQDRYEVGVVHRMRRPLAILQDATFTRQDPNFAEWQHGHGLYTTNGVVLSIVKRSHHGQPEPDLFLFGIPGYFSGYRPRYSLNSFKKDYFTWCILKGHTNNRAGQVLLSSPDPRQRPDINFHYFREGDDQHDDDVDAVVAGIEFVRLLMNRTRSLHRETLPGAWKTTRAELRQFVMDNAWGHHACGTCRMGRDGDGLAVLDSRFRVRGTTGLRVVDASVFPRIPGFFILSAIYMVAEKASDVILEDAHRAS